MDREVNAARSMTAALASPTSPSKYKRQVQIADFFDRQSGKSSDNSNQLGTECRVLDKQAPDIRVTFIFDD